MSHTDDDRGLTARLVALSATDRESLLQLLYAERGAHVESGPPAPEGWWTLRVTPAREGSFAVYLAVDPSAPQPSVGSDDRVVRFDGEGGDEPGVLTAADVAERVRYALSPAAQERVAETVFDTDRDRLLDTPVREREPPGATATSERDPRRDDRRTEGQPATRGPADDGDAGPGVERGGGSDGTQTDGDARTDDGVSVGNHTATDGNAQADAAPADAHTGDERPDSAAAGEASVSPVDGATRRSRVAFGGVALVGVLLVAAAFGFAPLPPGLDAGSDPPPARDFQPGGPPTATLTATQTATPADATRLPPGVSADGEIDEAVVADTTVAALTNRSYRFVVTYRERVDGEPTARLREVARVAGPTRYASRVSVLGEPVGSPSAVDRTAVYAADGRVVEQSAVSGAVQRGTPDGRDPFLDRLEQYVGWYLGVDRSRVVDTTRENGERRVFLRLEGDPWPGVENTTGTAVLTGDGVLREVHRSYTLPDRPNVRATVTVRVEAVGETTVRRPGWAAPAPLNGTASNRSDTAVGPATTDSINGTTVVVG